jgi:hypothetical protein
MSGFLDQEEVAGKKPTPVVTELMEILLQHWQLEIDRTSLNQIDSYDDANYFCCASLPSGAGLNHS